ncbi:unnamed protein product [Sphenostylis stenocarpa]|uniref:Uncharacterized protein n=1 Tax=Sphenostylis stenocarpa TaxID=92480 RepID=A0AA86VMP2_9FABA|nr:unnamed protein product [Sphenostylis stenocarpa]
MAETAVTFALQKLFRFLEEERRWLKGIGDDLSDIKHELEVIKVFIKDADRKAGDERGETNEGIKTWVKQVRDLCFSTEDVIDEYIMDVAPYGAKHQPPGMMSVRKVLHQIKALKTRYRIASEIQHIKSAVRGIAERSQRYAFHSQPEVESSSFSRRAKNVHRIASHFVEESDIVGFESQRDELIDCLLKENHELMVISVVGMGGMGKTTLAKHAFDNQNVKRHFDCRSFITVSQSYNVRQLLIDIIQNFSKDANEPIPKGLRKMDDNTLVTEVRQYLQTKRYLVLFDDVWTENFSNEIEHVLPNNNNGSRIIVTSRIMRVAKQFKQSCLFHVVHLLQPLSQEKAWELFCKKAFRLGTTEQCPPELEDVSKEIILKCGGLPLAIVTVGGLLSTKEKTLFEWRNVSKNLRMELELNERFTNLVGILSLSYDDLPLNLKSCMLYFTMYPEDYSIKSKRLTRPWIAEGFIENDKRGSMEDVAEEYLKELINRSLVQVSRVGFGGKVKSCHVHGILREFLIKKARDLSFCHIMLEDDELDLVGITRRLSLATCSDTVFRTSNSGIRAIFVLNEREYPKDYVDRLFAKFKFLRVLDFQGTLLNYVPANLGTLFHLRYLNMSHTKVKVLPRSIGKLVNLETLDLRQTKVRELPREITQLTKLRLLSVYYRKIEGKYSVLEFTTGVEMHKGIGRLKSLQKLYFLEADHGGLGLVEEIQMLKQLRKLGIRCVRREYATALSTAIGEMNHLESLSVNAIAEDEIIDLNFESAPPQLQVLNLNARVTKLPDWIPKLVYLVKLRLGLSYLKEDPLDSLKVLPNLMRLSIWDNAYAGESLHFRKEGFPKLKELDLTRLSRLSSMSIDEGALLGLEHLSLKDNPQMKVLPRGLQHLKNLRFLGFADMPNELVESTDPAKGGQDYWVIMHIPHVLIGQIEGPSFHDDELRPIPTLASV